MSLVRRLLGAAVPVWFLVVAGATIAVYSGQAEPYVSSTQLPGGPEGMFGTAAVALVAGWVVIGTLRSYLGGRSWQAAGRAAGLTPTGGGNLFGRADLTGTIDGRTVRARTVTRKRSSAGDSESTRQTFTLVETDLEGPSEAGLLVAPGGGGRITAGSVTLDVDAEHGDGFQDGFVAFEDDGLTVVGTSEATAQAVNSGRAGTALRELAGTNVVYVGRASDVVSASLSDLDSEGSGLGGLVQRKMAEHAEGALSERIPGDPSTVSAETVGLVLDGDELRRKAEAVVAVGDAFEDATAGS